MTDGVLMNDRNLLLIALVLSAVNLYISWKIASGLQGVSDTANTIGSIVKGL